MALIKCPDCGKMFSEHAECCPECGCPTEDAKAANVENDVVPQNVYNEESKGQASIEKTRLQEAVQPVIVESIAEKKKSNYRRLGIMGILAILVIGGVFAYNSLVTKNKTPNNDNQSEGVILDDSLTSKNITSIGDLSEEESLEVIKSVAKALKRYDNRELYYFNDGLAKVGNGKYKRGEEECVSSLYGKWGYVNLKGEEIVPCIYDDAYDFHKGLACVKKGGKCGFINLKGEEVIPFIYDNAFGFGDEGIACVKKGGKCGFINLKGEDVIPCIYDDAFGFSEGLACVKKGGKWGYINLKGEEAIPYTYDGAGAFHEGLAYVGKEEFPYYKYGYINLKGEEVIPCTYDWTHDFHEGLACVYGDNGKSIFINTKGEKVISFIHGYDLVSDFNEGMALVANEDEFKCGYINKKGEEVIPLIYDYGSDYETGYDTPCGSFSCGLASVCRDGKWGFINKQGEEIIPLKYDYAEEFRGGFGVVVKNGKYGYIDKYGHCTLDY